MAVGVEDVNASKKNTLVVESSMSEGWKSLAVQIMELSTTHLYA